MFPAAFATLCMLAAPIKKNVVDEVAWIVGDEPIFRSEIEEQYAQMRQEGITIGGDPYCVIPEQIAVEKLYLHQAKLDTVQANEGQVQSEAEARMQMFVNNLGSKERVEQYFNKPYNALKEQMVDMIRNQYVINMVQNQLTKNVKATPNDVKKFYASLPADSIPFVPLQVEAQIIKINPVIPQQEIEDVKARLRDYADRVNKGEANFSTLAIMYSEDGSAMQGGELGFAGRSRYVPEFANVAFNLNDPNKVSRIVETEYGYHIIQLIEKRGDQANFRHILLTPKVSQKDLENSRVKLDSLRKEILADKYSFEEAALFVSQDKDTKNNNGLMVNPQTGSSRFEMSQLPPEIATRIETMQPGELSDAFIMKDAAKNKDVVALVKLTSRVPGHKATLAEDFNMLKQMYEAQKKQQILKDWVENKIKTTYIKIGEGWDACEFNYDGWKK
ncbi:MAG: peptidylprolyl isomerase [Muribaculaceae bacterium]|nr:peptidylprolyl isomerase [Muribaculaceae bacterium]